MGSIENVQPKVSVIIPIKNRAHLVGATLDNLLAQTLVPYEIFLIDDGSTDDLAAALARFKTSITLLQNQGSGPGAARNVGLQRATGEFVQFFDSDDLLTKGKLWAQASALVATGAAMAYGPYVKAQETAPGQWVQRDVIMQAHPLPDTDLHKWILRGWNALTQSMLFRRSFLQGLPPWDTAFITHEDYLYMARVAGHKPTLVHVPKEAVIYRQHGQQSTGTAVQERAKALDAYRVLQLIAGGTNLSKFDWGTQILFNGRLQLNAQYTHQYAERELENVHQNKKIHALVYKFYNKFERILTNSPWERMHGVTADATAFSDIVAHIPPCKN